MNNFENQITDAFKNIRDLRQRPDKDRILQTMLQRIYLWQIFNKKLTK